MRNIAIHLLLIFLSSFAFAQVVGDSIPNAQATVHSKYNKFQYLKRITITKENLIAPKKLEKGKKYDRIEFMHFGKKLWFAAKIKKYEFGRYHFRKASSIRYVENDQLFSDFSMDDDGYLPHYEPIYYSNCQVWMHKKNIGKQFFEKIYNEDGSLYRDYSYSSNVGTPHPLGGTRANRVTSPVAGRGPNFQSYDDGISYLGYAHVGTLFTPEGWEITGFFSSMNKKRGNGGVFFIQNTDTGNCSWVTVLNSVIISTQPANCEEKPDIHHLNENINAQDYHWTIENISDNYRNQLKISDDVDIKKLWLSVDILEVNLKDSIPKDGYHFKMTPVTNNFYDDGVMVEVGYYQNGKLQGQGFKAQINYKPTAYYDRTYKDTGEVKYNAGSWSLAAGLFDQGNFISGRQFTTSTPYDFETDIFTKSPYKSFEFIGSKATDVTSQNIKINEVSKDNYFYIKPLKRLFRAVSIDRNKGLITVNTDIRGVQHSFDINKDEVYGWKSKTENYRQSCPSTIRKPVYKENKVLLYHMAPEVKTSSYTVTGVYYDKKVTTIRTTQGKPVYGVKYTIDHYEQVRCPECDGTGVLNKKRDAGGYARIIF